MVASAERRPLLPILVALSGAHLLNDLIQSMIPAIYPLLKEAYVLDFAQIGLITLAFQVTASLLQPVLGLVRTINLGPRDGGRHGRNARRAARPVVRGQLRDDPCLGGHDRARIGGIPSRGHAHGTPCGGRPQGFAQGIFQIGGHAGYAMGPLLAALIVVPRGQTSLAWASVVALIAMALMTWTAGRYAEMRRAQIAAANEHPASAADEPIATNRRVMFAMTILIILLLSKNGYTAAFTSYYTFFLIERFGVSVQLSQIMLFLYLVVGALGVIVGGMIGDRFGRHRVIWISILGSLQFALLLPYADLFWTGVLSVLVSLVMASAFSSILIYAIDLVPHRVGLVGGLSTGWHSGWAAWRPLGWACWPTTSASLRCSRSSPGYRRLAC